MLLLYKHFFFVQCCVRKSAGTKKISNVTKIGPFKDTLQNLAAAPVQHRTNKELTQFYFHLSHTENLTNFISVKIIFVTLLFLLVFFFFFFLNIICTIHTCVLFGILYELQWIGYNLKMLFLNPRLYLRFQYTEFNIFNEIFPRHVLLQLLFLMNMHVPCVLIRCRIETNFFFLLF